MKKSELITKLQAIPGDPEVAILDWLINAAEDSGDGSRAGIYAEFDVEFQGPKEIPEGIEPWIALSFENEYVDMEISQERTCRVCGCTEHDCSQCIEKTGSPCHWVEKDLCSACA